MSDQQKVIYIDNYVLVLRFSEEPTAERMDQIKETLLHGVNMKKTAPKVAKFDET